MVSADDGWAVGDYGTVIRWNGTAWSYVASPTTLPLYSVYMVSADDGWAVGYGGTIIRWNGTAWIPEFPTAMLMVFLIGFMLISIILAKKFQGLDFIHLHTKSNNNSTAN
jgi:predicted secreted protein with PEFG-CTERM motif